MSLEHEEFPLVEQARKAFAACQADLYDLESAQAEEVIEVTVRARSVEITIQVSHEVGFQVSALLLEHLEEYRRRLWERYLEKLSAQSLDAAIDLKNHFGHSI